MIVRPRPRFALLAALLILLLVALGLSQTGRVAAHPLGNFTVNRYARLDLYADALRILYVIDMAEVPAFQEREALDPNGDGDVGAEEQAAYLAARAPALLANLSLSVDGEPLTLRSRQAGLDRPPGQGGLETLRLMFLFEAPVAESGLVPLRLRDDNYAGRIGWREIVVRPGAGVAVSGAEAYVLDRADALRVYPEDLLRSPPDMSQASFRWQPGTGASAPALSAAADRTAPVPAARPGGSPASAFVGLIDLGEVVLVSILAAFGFGALHALEPGHGKAFVASYFVGRGGSPRQALLFGFVVAVSHSVGVFAVGLVLLFAAQVVVPDRLFPWLTLASGLLVIGLGMALLLERLGGWHGLRHRLGWGRHHSHAPAPDTRGPSWRGLLAARPDRRLRAQPLHPGPAFGRHRSGPNRTGRGADHGL